MRSVIDDQKGNVAVLAGLCLFGVAVGTGFAVNANTMQTTADYLQRVADSAAIGAVVAGRDPETSSDAVMAAGRAMAATMLVGRHADAQVNVQVEARDPTRVAVSITDDVDLIFGGLFSKEEATLSRDATAIAQTGDPVCLLVLNKNSPGALRLQGSPEINTDACSVQVNSTASKAVTVGGSASIDASGIFISGPSGNDGKMSPTPQYNQPVVEDPLKDQLSWPSLAGCKYVAKVVKKNDPAPQPGVYCGGLTFASGADVTLPAGTYVIQTGGLSFGSNARVKGPDGVTMVLIDPLGSVQMQGGPDVDLQAPTSGPWKGVVLAIKPQPTKIASSLNGGGSLILGGIVYMPSQHLSLQGGADLGGLPMARGFVVDTISLQGSGVIQLAGDPALASHGRNPRLIQ